MSSDYEPEDKKPKLETISLEKKIKIVNLAREHPNWKLATLRKNGAACLSRKDELTRWQKEIQKGGTVFDKSCAIKKWTYNKFCDARQNHIPVTTRNIQEWALQASMQHESEDFHFSASIAWTNRFKQEYRIRQRKVTKYVKSTEQRSPEEILKIAENFQKDTSHQISFVSSVDLDYVLNTDQMGCEYRSNVQRTLAHRGQKTVEVYLGDVNKVTHTYTAQYTITASGNLLPKVFICLQEPQGAFGPRVGERVQALVAEYKNVYVTCSKSGKLTSALFDSYTTNVLQPYVKDKQFRLVIDSFFHRQVKIFIKELQNCTHLLQEERQLNSREDAIKIQSLVTNQLCAPIFRNMIQYAWFASKLIQERNVFMSVKEVCFPERPCKTSCSCARGRDGARARSMGFVKCSWCREYWCFDCFYELYHPTHCTKYFINV